MREGRQKYGESPSCRGQNLVFWYKETRRPLRWSSIFYNIHSFIYNAHNMHGGYNITYTINRQWKCIFLNRTHNLNWQNYNLSCTFQDEVKIVNLLTDNAKQMHNRLKGYTSQLSIWLSLYSYREQNSWNSVILVRRYWYWNLIEYVDSLKKNSVVCCYGNEKIST